jgi:lipid II:glycine glycyltransferase (peptidoglycan interpeptide bridge formation enzyme)
MHPKTRYNIRLAQKHGVEVKDEFEISVGNGLFAKEAVSLIVETSQRQGYKGYGKEYYEDLINFLGLNNQAGLKLHIYKAIYKNQLLASAIMLDFAGTRTFLFGGSSDEHKNVMAPYLMHYRAMLDAKNLGLNFYDFWGIETSKGETPGFVRFKLGFGKPERVVEYSGAYDVIFSKYWYKIYTIFRKSKRIFLI